MTAATEVELSTPQQLQFQLMREARFNEFNPAPVIDDLLANRELWSGAVMDRAGWFAVHRGGEPVDLIKLRDIEAGYWNVDTLYILSSGKDDTRLELLAKGWQADEIGWLTGEQASAALGSSQGGRVLRVWWD